MTIDPDTITQALIKAAHKAGAESADAIARHGTSSNIDVRQGKLEQAERSEASDFGLRVFLGRRQAIVSASRTGQETINEMAERAVAMAREAPEDPYAGLADATQLARHRNADMLELDDPGPEPDPAELQDVATRAEAAALAVAGVTQVQSATASYSATRVHLATSNGFSAGYRRTGNSISCVAIAGEGMSMERDYDGDSRMFRGDLPPPEDIGERAGQRVVERLGARKPPTGSFPVLFDERISSTLIGHLLAATNGASIVRGASWARDLLGETILPAHLSITENPHRARVSGSRLFDAEGLETRIRRIVDAGVLTGWTLDLSSARKLGLSSTGNASRSPSGPPSPANWNIELTPGDLSREDLIRDMGTGLLVTSLIGSTVNPNTGDYSRGAAGVWVENGELAYPVNECTIAGNLRTMLASMCPANDARGWLARVVPSLLISGMTVAGQ